jgi:anti-sigma factor RsiW
MNFRDIELLSVYLDGRLSPSESNQLESRLASDQNLQAVMEDLRTARGLLRHLPQRRVPRNFTLTPKMAGLKAPEPRVYPVFRFATVLAVLLFIITFAVNGFAPIASPRLSAAQAPAIGLGGGCGNCGPSESGTAAPQAPQAFSAIAPTEGLSATQDNSGNLTAPAAPIAPKAAAPYAANNSPAPISTTAPVPLNWQISLGFIVLICGVTAWLLRLRSEKEFQKRWNKK